MFDNTQPVYSRTDGTYIIKFARNPRYHLIEDDPYRPAGLWDEVMTFIAENPDAVKPDPKPVFLAPPLELVEATALEDRRNAFIDGLMENIGITPEHSIEQVRCAWAQTFGTLAFDSSNRLVGANLDNLSKKVTD